MSEQRGITIPTESLHDAYERGKAEATDEIARQKDEIARIISVAADAQEEIAILRAQLADNILEKDNNRLKSENIKLRAQLASTRKALEPFANIGLDVLKNRPGWANEEFWSNWASHYRINYVDFERAAAVAIKLQMDADAAKAALKTEQGK